MKVDWDKVHVELESQGKFDEYTTPYNFDHTIPVDENYVYIRKSFGARFASFFYRSLVVLLGPLATKIAFGAKYYGKEKVKPLKKQGYFTVMNHCSYIDNLMLRHAIGDLKKVYLTVAPHNCKSGFAGHVLRAGGILPLAEKLSAVKNMNKAFHELIEKGNVIQVYAERAMWEQYEKPRPMKRGAFSFAVKENVPIVPVYIIWEPTTGLRKALGFKKRAIVKVLDPIYPKEGVSSKENTIYMQQETMREYVNEYRSHFGITKEDQPCIYDIAPEYLDTLNEETKFMITI